MTDFITADLPARHGFFTRNGGVSTGLYASLNASFSSDDTDAVRENLSLIHISEPTRPY